ncbi:MAG TPA: VOC family protein, partial [Dehalococcoidia bacterium]|nr:VOC family protein [Dehalococcoidia bacterium]
MTTSVAAKHDVGGVLLDRPFKIRRLGHFGFNTNKIEEAAKFYIDLLGFVVSDEAGFLRRMPELQDLGPGGFFTRYGTDHHAFVLFNKRIMDKMGEMRGETPQPGITTNQITWQVGSLAEVGNGAKWFAEEGVRIRRTGRDMPGSNWHTYVFDPDGHVNELYYGIEQVGWEGFSKPLPMYERGFQEAPPLPQINEFTEVQQAMEKGVDLHSGYRYLDSLPATYDVDGVLLPRPFKIVKIGPVGIYVEDVAAAKDFYEQKLGFTFSEEVSYRGYRCVYLRANTEHHSLAIYPIELRKTLGASEHSTCASFGLQLATYRQLRHAVGYLKGKGCRFFDLPPELHPGIDYAAHVLDPDGHCIQLYYYMEQIGWDGRPRPASERRPVAAGAWPEALEPAPDVYEGEAFMGP